MTIKLLLPALLLGAAASAADPAPPITAEQAAKVLDGVERNGDATIVPGRDLSIKLDLPTGTTDAYKVRYETRSHRTKGGDEHSFGRTKDSGEYLIVVRTKEKISYVRLDKNFKFVAAASQKTGADAPETLSEAEAGPLMARELKRWAARAGK